MDEKINHVVVIGGLNRSLASTQNNKEAQNQSSRKEAQQGAKATQSVN